MRSKFVEALVSWGENDPNLYLLTGDLGFSVLEPFANKFPERFINVGISEQNMVGIAAGLAKLGKRLFVYSIVNFGTLRCLEQIRNDICYHNMDVVIAVVGGGFAYGTHGYTHLGLEDIAATLPLPNMKVFSPADSLELEGCMNYIRGTSGPCYLRMARGGESDVHDKVVNLNIDLLKPPFFNVNLLSHGTIYSELLAAKSKINKQLNINIGTFSIPLLKPFPEELLQVLLKESEHLFIFEEHSKYGGLGSLVASIAAPLGLSTKIHTYGTTDEIIHIIGNQSYMREKSLIDANHITEIVIKNLPSDVSREVNQKN